MHIVGFIIRIYHDARSPERQIPGSVSVIVFKWVLVGSDLSSHRNFSDVMRAVERCLR